MKAMIFGMFSVLVMTTAAQAAPAFKLPMQPTNSGVVCNDNGIDAMATATPNEAAIRIEAYGKKALLSASPSKNGNVVSFAATDGKLEVNFDRALPGSDAFQGELDVELDGQRLHVDIPCRLLFMGKQPSLKAWQ